MSDPTSAEYGKHLSWDQVTNLVKPSAESVATVIAWLQSHDMDNMLSPSLDFITAIGTVAQVEEMLATELHVYHHAKGRRAIRAPQGYSLPAHIAPHIDFIADIAHFPHMSAKISSSDDLLLGVASEAALQRAAAANDNTPLVLSARPGDATVTAARPRRRWHASALGAQVATRRNAAGAAAGGFAEVLARSDDGVNTKSCDCAHWSTDPQRRTAWWSASPRQHAVCADVPTCAAVYARGHAVYRWSLIGLLVTVDSFDSLLPRWRARGQHRR